MQSAEPLPAETVPDSAAEMLLAHLQAAHLLALRISGSAALAEDIVQEAFTRALPAARRQPPQDARTWLLRITANVAKNCLRSGRTQQRIKAQMQQSAAYHLDRPQNTELIESLRANLERLDEKHRVPLSLHYEQGLTLREVSEVIGVPEGTAGSLVSRGLERLRDGMARDGCIISASVFVAVMADLAAATAVRPEFAAMLKNALANPAASGAAGSIAVKSGALSAKTAALALIIATIAGAIVYAKLPPPIAPVAPPLKTGAAAPPVRSGPPACSMIGFLACNAPGHPTLTPDQVLGWLKESVELTPDQLQRLKDEARKWGDRQARKKELEAAVAAIPIFTGSTGSEIANSPEFQQAQALKRQAAVEFDGGKGIFILGREMKDSIDAVLNETQREQFNKAFAEKFKTVAATVELKKKDNTVLEGKLLMNGITTFANSDLPPDCRGKLLLVVKGKEVLLDFDEVQWLDILNPAMCYRFSQPVANAWPAPQRSTQKQPVK